MNPLHYRQEDRFQEELNSRRLKELHKAGDINGLLDFALLLNHQVSSANSKIHWLMKEQLSMGLPPVNDGHFEMVGEVEKLMREKEEGEKG